MLLGVFSELNYSRAQAINQRSLHKLKGLVHALFWKHNDSNLGAECTHSSLRTWGCVSSASPWKWEPHSPPAFEVNVPSLQGSQAFKWFGETIIGKLKLFFPFPAEHHHI